jgi:very-short-patch-repair endonuclease
MKSSLEQKFSEIWSKLAPDLYLESQFKDHRIRGLKRPYVFDFRITGTNILIEINGGTGSWKISAHRTAHGVKRDYTKLNRAQMHGYQVFCFSSIMVKEEIVIELVKYAYYKINSNQINKKFHSTAHR